MAIVGAATRLTDSGLSITEWQPLLGAIPPLSDAHWQEAFAKYRAIPEYAIVNQGMSLDGFKAIYWWEWAHRLLGRLIGIAILLPLAVLWWRGQIRGMLAWKCIGLFALVGLQGFAGWFMVQSGLLDRVDVSQYRLALHLAIAVLIFALAFWLALDHGPAPQTAPTGPRPWVARSAAGLIVAIYLQIVLGAFVAGLDAGLSHNTWPLMDGQFVPDGLLAMSPWYLNLFENVATVQFDHRMLAYLIAAWALGHGVLVLARNAGIAARGAVLLIAAVLIQIGIGIATLLAAVPIGLGLLHQAGAFIVLAIALWHRHDLVAARRAAAPTQRPVLQQA